jgi:uncharacterized protein (DUF2141 family)
MTKTIAVVLIGILAVAVDSARAAADQGSAANLVTVEVVDLHGSSGVVNCALFASADGFPDVSNKAAKIANATIENRHAVCGFPDVAPGDYAVSAFHDENSDGKLDRNFMGIPKEGVGASNDAKRKVRASQI